MAAEIHTKRGREALDVRRDPHWGPPIAPRAVVGYRKLANGSGSWVARIANEQRTPGGNQYAFHALKDVATDDYDGAVKAARAWFMARSAGIDTAPVTVRKASEEYVADLKAEGRDGAAKDAEYRFKRAVYDDPLGAVPLDKLRTAALKEWRNRVAGTKAAQDRSFRSLKAALNFAVLNRRVSPAVAIEWKSVPMHKGADNRRELFLDLRQRRALLAACGKGALRHLVEAAALTGARPGELVALKRSDFDARTSTITFAGKTGARSVPLAPAAVKLFKRLAKGKQPPALLLPQDDGAPWYSTLWARELRAAVARAELPAGVVLYTLRHSWITEALRAGMSTLDVARLTGTSLPMIQSHYGHLVADAARERLADVVLV